MGNLPAKFESDAPKPVSSSAVRNQETNDRLKWTENVNCKMLICTQLKLKCFSVWNYWLEEYKIPMCSRCCVYCLLCKILLNFAGLSPVFEFWNSFVFWQPICKFIYGTYANLWQPKNLPPTNNSNIYLTQAELALSKHSYFSFSFFDKDLTISIYLL